MKRADVAILVMDASQGIGETETKVAELILENRKACIFAMNKWDLIEDREIAAKMAKDTVEDKLKFVSWAKLIYISAKTGQRTNRILKEALTAYEQYSRVIPHDKLAEVVREAERKKPFARLGKVLRIREVNQEGIHPPHFSLGVNETSLVHFSYRRYLENNIRAAFGFFGTPITLRFFKE